MARLLLRLDFPLCYHPRPYGEFLPSVRRGHVPHRSLPRPLPVARRRQWRPLRGPARIASVNDSVPDDGPAGDMLTRMGRHPNRPGHMHMMMEVTGHERLITHIFVSDSPYLDSDAVFGVRNSLVVDFPRHEAGTAPDGRVMTKPYYTASYDFRLVPSAA